MEFSKDKFLQIIESIKECYFEVDLKGNIIYFNNALCDLTGYTREELFGLNYKFIADEENQIKIFKGFNSVYRTGEPITDLEYQFMNRAGERFIGETSVYLKHDSEGNKIGFYGLFRDITKRKREEERFKEELEQLVSFKTKELKESEEKYSNLFHHSNDAIFLHDLEGNILDVNQRVLEQFGFTREEILKLNISDLHPTSELESSKKAFEEISKKGFVRFEISFKKKNGKIFLADVSSSLFEIGGKQVIQGIVRDITVRILTGKMLKESEEKYRNLVENAHEGVWAVDENDNTIFVNPKICEMLGYTRDEIMSKSLHLFLDDAMIELINSYRERRAKGLKDSYELEFIKKDGTILSTRINASPILNENGEFKGSFAFINDITQRKIAEQKLKESEEKYRIISENANDLITIVDTKLRLEYINEQVHKRVMGYIEDDLIGINGLDLIHPDERELTLQEIATTLKTGRGNVEARIKHKDGHYVWTETSGSTIEDRSGKLKVLLITRVIDERKRTEQRLKESEEKYRNMINHLDLGFYQLNWDGILLNHNPRFSEILGYDSSDDLKSKDVHDFWQEPNERTIYLKELEKKGFVKNYIVHAKKKNGEKIVVQLNSHIIKGNEEESKIIQGLISDITEKFELEQKVKESEERYRNLIESVPFSIALIEQQGKLIYCNPAIEKLLGYKREELIGYEFKDLPVINPKYIPIMLKRFQRVLKGEILPPLEIELYKKDKSLVWIKYQSTLVKLGGHVLLQTIINDITEQKKADLLIEEEIIKLKELDQIRKDLISRVSHELKTPLVSVCGASELLLDLYIDQFKDEPKELIEMIEKGGKRLRYLVDNLVDITRIEYKKFELNKKRYNINQLIRDCCKEMMYLIKKRELNLELNLSDEIFLDIDKIRIEQVILNLLSNAIKNTPPKGKILIKSSRKDNFIEILVKDTGIGLTKEEMDKLFLRFGKIERYGNGLEYIDIQGTGLGLYISKEIIDLHKGQIWAESKGRDKGSIFTINLPLSKLIDS